MRERLFEYIKKNALLILISLIISTAVVLYAKNVVEERVAELPEQKTMYLENILIETLFLNLEQNATLIYLQTAQGEVEYGLNELKNIIAETDSESAEMKTAKIEVDNLIQKVSLMKFSTDKILSEHESWLPDLRSELPVLKSIRVRLENELKEYKRQLIKEEAVLEYLKSHTERAGKNPAIGD